MSFTCPACGMTSYNALDEREGYCGNCNDFTGRGPKVTVVPKSAWMLMPPAPDVCQVCATDHEPHEPHNPDSIYWQTAREIAGESSPTWKDALAHVEEPLRTHWTGLLAQHGVKVDE